jgi:hypothetical protein
LFEVVRIVYIHDVVIIFMTKTLKEICDELLNLSHEEKLRLAKLASEALARRTEKESS